MTKKILTIIVVVAMCLSTFAHRGPGFRPGPWRHHHYHHSPAPFLIGAGLGLAASVLAPTRVWIPPVIERRPIYNQFGQIIGWQDVVVRPGYWSWS